MSVLREKEQRCRDIENGENVTSLERSEKTLWDSRAPSVSLDGAKRTRADYNGSAKASSESHKTDSVGREQLAKLSNERKAAVQRLLQSLRKLGLRERSTPMPPMTSEALDETIENLQESIQHVSAALQHLLMDFEEHLRAGMLRLSDVVHQRRQFRLADLGNFFDVMEVWGTHHDIDTHLPSDSWPLVARQYALPNSEDLDFHASPDPRIAAAKLHSPIPSLTEQRIHNAAQVSILQTKVSAFNDELAELDATSKYLTFGKILNSSSVLWKLVAKIERYLQRKSGAEANPEQHLLFESMHEPSTSLAGSVV